MVEIISITVLYLKHCRDERKFYTSVCRLIQLQIQSNMVASSKQIQVQRIGVVCQ